MLPNSSNNNNNNKNITSPFSKINRRPEAFHYDENLVKPNDIMSTFKSKYEKFNTSSDFFKTTISIFPNSNELINQIGLPMGINISPLSRFVDESTIPVCDYGESYDIPCCKNVKCKAYLNPFVKFLHGSDQWQCNMCKNINKTLDYYYCAVDSNGVRLDQNTKPELNFGTYDFIEYKNFWHKDRPPIKISYYFLIDISLNSINSGFAQCVLESIKDMINNDNFYKYEEFDIKICIITFDDQIHFYPININKSSEQNISMLSINESSNELFLPTNKDYLLVDLKKYKNTFIQIIENIQNNINSGNAGGNIKDSNRFFDVIKICNLIGDKKGGKILIFSGSNVSGLPLMNGLKNIDESINPKYLITDGGQIGRLGINISLNGLSVNIFESCSNDTNIRTLNQLITNSNGNLFFYRNFNSDLHYKNLYNQIRKILTNQNVLEAGLKFRFSKKFTIKEYITPVLLYNKEIIYFPNLDSDQNYSFLLSKMEENDSQEKPIDDDDFLFIQASLAYTSGDGKRKVRVFNKCIPFSSRTKDIYESINPEVLSSFLTQYLIMNIYRKKNLIEAVNMVEKKYYEVNVLYFNNLNPFTKELNEEMKLFCLYFLGLMKNKLFNKNEKGFNNDNDLSTFFRTRMQKTKFEDIICFIYPRIYLIDNILDLDNEFPLIINNNKESLDTQGSIFLVDDGFQLTLYLKNNVDKNILYNLFGVNSFNELNLGIINESNVFDYNENKNEFNNKLIDVIDNIRASKALFQNLQIIFEGINDKNGTIINDFLIEDNFNKSFPYDYEKFYHKIVFK